MKTIEMLGNAIGILYFSLLVILPPLFSYLGETSWAVVTIALGFVSFGFLGAFTGKSSDATGMGCAYVILCFIVGIPIYYISAAFQNYPFVSVGSTVLFVAAGIWTARKLQESKARRKLLEEEAAEQKKLDRKRQAEEARKRQEKEKKRRIQAQVKRERIEQEHRRKAQMERERKEREQFELEVAKIAEVGESIERLRSMTGAEFENFMADFLQMQGYKVEHLAGSGDQGVDLIITEGKKRIAIQLKRYSRPLGNKPVQEVHTGRFFHKANEAWVITTSSFTRGGIEAARKTFVRLIDGDELFAWIADASEETERRRTSNA